MIRNPDMVIGTIEGKELVKPDWHKVFLFIGKEQKIIKHECMYEGKVAYEKLRDHLIISQITVRGEIKEGDTYKDIETTPFNATINRLIPRNEILRDNKLWRYLSFYKFEDLINSGTLHFARLDQFKDNLEGISPISCIRAIITNYQENEEQKQEALKLYALRMQNNRKVSFACCWHINKKINLHLWNEYGNNSEESIAIQTRVRTLDNILMNSGFPVLNEPVQYLDEQYFNQNAYWFPTIFKRTKFKHEQEYRSIIFVHGLDSKGLKIKINPEELITKIYVHPRASKEYFKKVRLLVKDKGLKIPINLARY